LLLALLVLRPGLLGWPLLSRAAIGVGALGLALLPFLRPYLALHGELGLARDIGQAEWFGMDLLSILHPGLLNTLCGGRLVYLARSEGGLFPGFVALALLAAAAWGLRREPVDRPAWTRSAGRLLLVALAVCLLVIAVVPATGGVTLALGRLRL